MDSNNKIRVLFICLGNICRSPMAEAVFKHMVQEAGLDGRFEIRSAATSSWEVGNPPHPGTRAVLKQHGIPLDPTKRSVQVRRAELEQVDYLLAMDYENLVDLRRISNGSARAHRLMEYAGPGHPDDVPDPYYTGEFEYVYGLIETGCKGLLAAISG